ncbi:beta-ketoacyl-[acyl-carrier-protein] synthase family protein [Streptomyces djakartensis]|uniref:3-oxoacyl-[acyl-carrier-protein] synthase 2 n=1 Tax=Streptomyces djakartensis TaxID=68193 RepID=A0ABQ2Z0L7_9ACTN|nr:beta-ketoacyl-[acyl-carrier-protein] synthase family protein [Streptomyces djakartensis]GGY01286.1 3-oxoacyl-[acyl-carrier-protein] synthase 2 [Streptomyces djakartensis]
MGGSPSGEHERFDAAVTGLGMMTPAGAGTAASWERIREGAGTEAVRMPELAGITTDFACRVPGFDPVAVLGRRRAGQFDRSSQLVLAAAMEAVADSGLDPQTWDGARVGVVLGNGIGGAETWETQHRRLLDSGPRRVSPRLIPMLSANMAAGYVSMEFGARGPSLVTATACASGTTAIGTARDLLRSGACDVVITGGTEAPLTPSLVTGFSQMGALSRRSDDVRGASRPFDADRDGFVVAEGAAVLVLERAGDARARGARIRAMISGYGASADAYHPTAPDPECTGAGLALRAALRDAGVGPDEVDHVNAHGTSTLINDATEARLIRGALGDRPLVTSVKGVTGHSLAAAGAIEAAVAALTLADSFVPPTANLESLDPEIELDVVAKEGRATPVEVVVSNSFGFGGQNAVLLLTRA